LAIANPLAEFQQWKLGKGAAGLKEYASFEASLHEVPQDEPFSQSHHNMSSC
jgi:hypothetical protein